MDTLALLSGCKYSGSKVDSTLQHIDHDKEKWGAHTVISLCGTFVVAWIAPENHIKILYCSPW